MTTVGSLLKQILFIQSSNTGTFDAGLVPAHRQNTLLGYRRADTTLFFTAITVFTLQKISHLLTPDEQSVVENIAQKALGTYAMFENKDGLKTYNFWKTHPSQHFPNGYVFRHFDHFRIPDDADDTAFAYLTSSPTPAEVHWLKDKLSAHANLATQQIQNTYPEYQSLRAYSTWFGKHMYVEFDACVLSNVLYFVFEYGLPLNQHDTDSLFYIRSVVETGRYLTEPFRVAHQYPRSALIVYHVARLVAAFDPEALRPIRQQLTQDIEALLPQATHPLDVVILGTSLLRLGRIPARTVENIEATQLRNYPFFIAGLLTAYEHRWLYKLARWPIFHMTWQCEAHCLALLVEYRALLQNFSATLQAKC